MEVSGESRYYGRSGGVEVCHVGHRLFALS